MKGNGCVDGGNESRVGCLGEYCVFVVATHFKQLNGEDIGVDVIL